MDSKKMNQDQFIQHLEDKRENDNVRIEFIRLIHEKIELENCIGEYKTGLLDSIALFVRAEKSIRAE
jgi:hypothetical protein